MVFSAFLIVCRFTAFPIPESRSTNPGFSDWSRVSQNPRGYSKLEIRAFLSPIHRFSPPGGGSYHTVYALFFLIPHPHQLTSKPWPLPLHFLLLPLLLPFSDLRPLSPVSRSLSHEPLSTAFPIPESRTTGFSTIPRLPCRRPRRKGKSLTGRPWHRR